MDFKDLPLHDALVKEITVNWQNKTVTLALECFLKTSQSAQPCLLRFTNVSSVLLPLASPWGESSSINGASFDGNAFQIEVQSGDVLHVQSAAYDFETIGL